MKGDAGSLRCPQCGAPASPETTVCSHCRTTLAVVACPSCFAQLFKGYAHCPRCGAEAARAESDSTADRRCPHCQAALSAAKVGAVTLGECPICSGLWADAASFERICKEREEQTAVLGAARPVVPAQDKSAPAGAALRYWPCPQCGQLMNRLNFALCSGVIVDVCRPHGVWFDCDELRRVVEFIRSGGMDRARQREKEDIREQRQRLRDQERALAQKARVDGRPGFDAGSIFDDTVDAEDLFSAAADLLNWLDID